ncbi:MAG: hypothetical protein WCM76_13375 [Bacteroidota bacterium]
MKTKTTLFTALLLLSALISGAQNYTLHFSQVKLIGTTVETVPVGKVWKIENVILPNLAYIKYSQSLGGSCGCGVGSSYSRDEYVTAYTATALAGRNNISINSISYALNPTTTTSNIVWLPAGSTVGAIQQTTPAQYAHSGGNSCYAPWWLDGVYQDCNAYTPPQVTITPLITVIEFNIVP